MDVFICRDEFESILSGIYDAGTSGKRSAVQRLALAGVREPEPFCRYLEVIPERRKAKSVMTAVREKIGAQACELLWEASLSGRAGKADHMYRFLVDGFRRGPRIVRMLSLDSVFQMYEMQRYVRNEAHLLTGFVRFSRLPEGILAGRIGPKNDVLSMVAEHFEDRLSGENWLLWDELRDKAAVHQADRETVLIRGIPENVRRAVKAAGKEDPFGELWKTFVNTISIRERENRKCQMTHLPLRYREYMTEWDGEETGGSRVG